MGRRLFCTQCGHANLVKDDTKLHAVCQNPQCQSTVWRQRVSPATPFRLTVLDKKAAPKFQDCDGVTDPPLGRVRLWTDGTWSQGVVWRMPIQRDHAAERDARIDAFLAAVRRSKETACGQTPPDVAPPPPAVTENARLTK